MGWFLKHLRTTLLTGVIAAIPLIVVVYVAILIEKYTKPLTEPLGFHFPGLGFLVALVGVYLLGLVVTSILGAIFLRLLDRVLEKLPGFNQLYHAWKEVVLLPEDRASTFHQVVLVAGSVGPGAQVGFTSGQGVAGDPHTWCVFLPNIPNPLPGRRAVWP